MKKLIAFIFVFAIIGQSYSQITLYHSFNYTGALNANGWTTHSGTAAQFQSDNAGSLTYPNLAISQGNKANFVAGNGEDVNYPTSLVADSAYYSFLLNVPSSNPLSLNTSTTGDNFIGFGQTAGASLTVFAGQIRIRQGTVPNTFQIALVNSGAGSLVPTNFSQDLQVNTTYFLVVRVLRTTSPIQATLWINPTPGSANPSIASQTSIQGTSTLSAFASVYLRQSGSATAGTGNLQVDEIRVGTTWESVTPCASPVTYYADVDGDLYGNPNSSIQSCSVVSGYVLDNSDCDDANPLLNPNKIWYEDSDSDGFGNLSSFQKSCTQPTGYVENSSDCNDLSKSINPNTVWYADADGDGFGNLSSFQKSCSQPTGYVDNSSDCDDTNNQIYPGATEICDSKDNNCDGKVDEGFDFSTYYTDSDGDGFGGGVGESLCQNPGSGFVTIGGDCNDNNDQIYPGATEICDSKDNNCDGKVDEGLDFSTYYTDSDGDGFGGGVGESLCQNPGSGFVSIGGDCDDNNKLINPNATDVFGNSIDENCDGEDGTVGIQEISKIRFSVYPNPNDGSFLIQFNQQVNYAEIKLTDLNGKVIRVDQFNGDFIQITENNLEKGLYFLQVSLDGNKFIERIIIQPSPQ